MQPALAIKTLCKTFDFRITNGGFGDRRDKPRMTDFGRERPGSFYPTPCRKTHDRRRRAPQILENRGVGRWRTCSRFALLCEIPCRIEKVRDNLGGGVFRQGSRGCYFVVRSKPRGVATVQARSMPSKSRKPREWPIHPKPDIPGRLLERLLRPILAIPPGAVGADVAT